LTLLQKYIWCYHFI